MTHANQGFSKFTQNIPAHLRRAFMIFSMGFLFLFAHLGSAVFMKDSNFTSIAFAQTVNTNDIFNGAENRSPDSPMAEFVRDMRTTNPELAIILATSEGIDTIADRYGLVQGPDYWAHFEKPFDKLL